VKVATKILLSTLWGVTLLAGVMFVAFRSFLPSRQDLVETLDEPRTVASWTSVGFVLETGETVPIPGIDAIRPPSAILDEIARRGIEIDPVSQRVHGLLPVWHWCGNDPIGRHVARVDVESLVTYLALRGDPEHRSAAFDGMGCDSVGESGWNVSCFHGYNRWLEDTRSPR